MVPVPERFDPCQNMLYHARTFCPFCTLLEQIILACNNTFWQGTKRSGTEKNVLASQHSTAGVKEWEPGQERGWRCSLCVRKAVQYAAQMQIFKNKTFSPATLCPLLLLNIQTWRFFYQNAYRWNDFQQVWLIFYLSI